MHHYIFSWTSTKLKCRISCSNLADFKYNSLVYQVQLRSIFIKHINIEICLWYALPEINVFQIFIFHKVLFTGFIKNPQQLVKQVFYNRVIKGGILEYMRILQSNYSAWIRVALIVNWWACISKQNGKTEESDWLNVMPIWKEEDAHRHSANCPFTYNQSTKHEYGILLCLHWAV